VTVLDIAQIAAEALALLDEEGVTGFTMRALAKRLKVTPMALYHHVKDKAALATLVVNTAMKEFPDALPDGDWHEDMLQMARWTQQFTRAHPSVAELRRKYQVWTPEMIRMGERWVHMWQRAGLDTDRAMVAASLSGMLIVGYLSEGSFVGTLDLPGIETLATQRNSASPTDTPAEYDAAYELALRSVIAGVHAQMTASAVKPQ